MIQRFLSKKLLVASMCFVLVLLDGLGVASFSTEVLAVATGGLVTYIGAQGLVDYSNGEQD